MKNVPILILGAGPAGLSLARELSEHNLKAKILERAPEVGNTFYKMTDSTEYGPWLNNTLPGSPMPLTHLFARTTRGEYARYLSQYRTEHKLDVDTNTAVVSCRQTDEGYEVETNRGMYHCKVLVNATGYFSNPFIPDYSGMEESSIPVIHSCEYISPVTLAERLGKPKAKILIVGCRLSAGEIMEELYKVGHELHLSHRSKMKYWPSPLEEALRSPVIMSWERIALKIHAPKPGNLKPRLRRGFQKSLLDKGLVTKHPNVECFDGDTIKFVDGQEDTFDLVLCATGYRAVLRHLWPLLDGEAPKVSKLESKTHKNLFFMGYENSRNFRSQFLRGIRDDARYLAETLAERRGSFEPIATIHKPTLIPETTTVNQEASVEPAQ